MRIENNTEFQLGSLSNKRIEKLVAVSETNCLEDVDILCIKTTNDDLWNRVFLDAGCGFWEQMSELDLFYDFSDYYKIDLLKEFNLSSTMINSFVCTVNTLSEFNVNFDNSKLVFCYTDLNNSESLTKIKHVDLAKG